MSERLEFREAVNVPDALRRDQLVRRAREIRAAVVLDKNTIEHWNAMHPHEEQIDTSFEDAVIAWCDGKGPFPAIPGSA